MLDFQHLLHGHPVESLYIRARNPEGIHVCSSIAVQAHGSDVVVGEEFISGERLEKCGWVARGVVYQVVREDFQADFLR